MWYPTIRTTSLYCLGCCPLASIWGCPMTGIGGRSEDGMKERSEYLFLFLFPYPATAMPFINNSSFNALQFNPLFYPECSNSILLDFD